MINKLISLVEQLTELKSAIGKLFKKDSAKKGSSLPQSIVHGAQTNNNVEGNQTNVINITAVITNPEDLAKYVGGNPRGMEMFEQIKDQQQLPLKIVNKDTTEYHPLPVKKINDAE